MYSRDFREGAVALVASGRSTAPVARELGVLHSTASRKLRRNAGPDGRYDAGYAGRRVRRVIPPIFFSPIAPMNRRQLH